MATVEVWKKDKNQNNVSKLGQGTGNKDGATVTITAWTDKPGLVNGTTYGLKVDKAWYSGTAAAAPPAGAVAHFTGVE
jgi:hypothetical protein